MAAHERLLIATALAAHGGSIKATLAALQISRKTLYEKMQRHGLDRESFRKPYVAPLAPLQCVKIVIRI